MNKIVVLYQSKFDGTERYAEWLSEEFDCDMIKTKEADISEIKQYDVVILGGDIYEGKIGGLSFIKENFAELKDKRIAVFAVGATPRDERAMSHLKARLFVGGLENIPCFYCPGVWNEELMSSKDRFWCLMMKRVAHRRRNAQIQPWESLILQSQGANLNWTDKKYLEPIIELADSWEK